jgi:hypothetical protein
MITRKFWPLDYDPEGAIYENLAWDLPGYRATHSSDNSKPAASSRAARRGPKHVRNKIYR